MSDGADYAYLLAYISKLEREVALLRRDLSRAPHEAAADVRKTCGKCGESRLLLDFGSRKPCKYCNTKNYRGYGVTEVRASLGIHAKHVTADLVALKSDQIAAKRLSQLIKSTLKDLNETL